jgi:hypothetical protein
MSAHQHPGPDPRLLDLAVLVGEWLDWSQVAARLDVPVSRVGRLVKEHQLAAAAPDPGAGARVPAGFLQEGEIVKGLPGLITLLHDGGYDDVAIITWVFTDDPTLPGRPIDALRENRGSEVKRRAQAMGF